MLKYLTYAMGMDLSNILNPLHHVMGRGIERKEIFFNDTDRSDFIDRLGALCEEGAMDVYAWVFMPNH